MRDLIRVFLCSLVHGDGKELTTSVTELWDVGIRWNRGKMEKGLILADFGVFELYSVVQRHNAVLPRIPTRN